MAKITESAGFLFFIMIVSSAGTVISLRVIWVAISYDDEWLPMALFGSYWMWAAVSSGKRFFKRIKKVPPPPDRSHDS
jgi:hypothetical protein